MRKIIYYGISSDAPSLPSPFLPKFLELLDDDVDTLAAYGTFFVRLRNVVIISITIIYNIATWLYRLHYPFFRTCLTARQVSRVPVDERHVGIGIQANHTKWMSQSSF